MALVFPEEVAEEMSKSKRARGMSRLILLIFPCTCFFFPQLSAPSMSFVLTQQTLKEWIIRECRRLPPMSHPSLQGMDRFVASNDEIFWKTICLTFPNHCQDRSSLATKTLMLMFVRNIG
jgi:hypothetical protein